MTVPPKAKDKPVKNDRTGLTKKETIKAKDIRVDTKDTWTKKGY